MICSTQLLHNRFAIHMRWLAVLILTLTTGCGARLNYTELNGYLRTGSCVRAKGFVDRNKGQYGFNQKLLYLLDAAMVHTLCGEYTKSNDYLHKAEELAEQLWTKSVSKEMASFLLNDYTRPYSGEDFERALINLISALNYLSLGKYDEALVEARRLDSLLSVYNEKYGEKNVYKEDALGRYLSGIIYEATNSPDDAYISYYKAFEGYQDYENNYDTPIPYILIEDLFRLAEKTDRMDELGNLATEVKNSGVMKYQEAKKLGKIVLVHLNGVAPTKIEQKLFIPTQHGPVALAFPRYVPRYPSCRRSTLVAESRENGYRKEAESELAEDITAIAIKNLDDRKNRIIARTIARAVVKQVAITLATDQIENSAVGKAAKLLFNFTNAATLERADTRSWRTLPGEIYLSRIFLPEGEYTLSVELCDGGKESLGSVTIKPGMTRFFVFDSL